MKKIKTVQIGITHEHADGKMATIKHLHDLFDLAGVVNDLDSSVSPRFINQKKPIFDGVKEISLDEALNMPGLEAAFIEVPNNELVPMAIRFAEKGIALHMDKPAGLDLDLYRELLDICKEKKIPFQMGYMFRGNAAFQYCLKAIREKLVGEVFSIEADMHHNYGGAFYQEYIGKYSGGIMYNLGCHLIDFAVAALGAPEKVTPFLRSAPGDPEHIRNNCSAILEYPHAIVSISACSKSAGTVEKRKLVIRGTKGTLELEPVERYGDQPLELHITMAEACGAFPIGKHIITFPSFHCTHDRYKAQLIELASAIKDKKELSYSLEHDYLVHKVTLAAAGYIRW